MIRRIADAIGKTQDHTPIVVCDNTLLGPVFQRPIEHGADISLYSLTKYVGGHSDLIAGAVLGPKAVIKQVKALRGSRSARSSIRIPAGCSARSLETLQIRMERANSNARAVADFLPGITPKVETIHYLPYHDPQSPVGRTFATQCTGAGSTFSFEYQGRPAGLLQVPERAEDLQACRQPRRHGIARQPSGCDDPFRRSGRYARQRIGVLESTIRLSIGIEHPDDLIADLALALDEA